MQLQTLISQNYALVFLVIVNFILLSVNSMIEKKIRSIFYIVLFLEIIEVIFQYIPEYLGHTQVDWVINTVVCHVNYALRPTLLFLILLVSERNRTRKFKRILAVPLLITSILLAVSIPTKLVVYYSYPERIFKTGPLFHITWLILLIYLLLILISAIITNRKLIETASIIVCMLFICCNMIYELILEEVPGMRQTVIALSILTYYMFFQSQTYAKYRIEKEKELTKAQIQAMISQIKPHFIYNSLSCIAEICHDGCPEGENAILTFSDYLRSCLNSLEEDGLVPFSQELSTIQKFADLEKLQQEDKLNMVYNISEVSFRIPVLSIETLVENAVKHGIRKKRGGGIVSLSTFKEDNNIIIRIEDDGVGFDPDSVENSPNRLGLCNACMRLTEQCGATIDIHSVPGEGTKIEIVFPEDNSK